MLEESRIEEAASRREQQEAQLYLDDGTKLYGDEEHKERMAAIKREHAASFDRIESEIGERVAAAEEALLVAEHVDPAAGLSTDELQRASAMNAFVAGEVEGLSLADLARRCRAAASSGDKGAMYALAHHADRRVGESDVTSDEPGAEEVRAAAAELRHALDPDARAKLTAAREALVEAEDLRFKAQVSRAGAKDAFDFLAPRGYWTPAS